MGIRPLENGDTGWQAENGKNDGAFLKIPVSGYETKQEKHPVEQCRRKQKEDFTMMVRRYEVQMYTPMGAKPGELLVIQEGTYLNGWLDILQHREPIKGTVDQDGNCRIEGIFITLMNTVSFTAVGRISDSHVDLHMEDQENRHFRMTGSLCKAEERSNIL